jgi:hypothetical protein
MRMKDAVIVTLVLGGELRDTTPEEVPRVVACMQAIRGHVTNAHADIFGAAVERARGGVCSG